MRSLEEIESVVRVNMRVNVIEPDTALQVRSAFTDNSTHYPVLKIGWKIKVANNHRKLWNATTSYPSDISARYHALMSSATKLKGTSAWMTNIFVSNGFCFITTSCRTHLSRVMFANRICEERDVSCKGRLERMMEPRWEGKYKDRRRRCPFSSWMAPLPLLALDHTIYTGQLLKTVLFTPGSI